ncbi:MAG: hypothetical protein GX649_19010, partial [Chloroflexi bacterium]|nr:hypothetical protein [Chloroflexota bacterium]
MSNHDIPTWTLRPAHDWLRPLRVAFDLTSPTRVVAQAASGLRAAFERLGHRVDLAPEPETEVVIANAGFGQPISWRRAPLFMAGRRYRMARTPTVVTLISASVREVEDLLERLAHSLALEAPGPSDFDYPGVAPRAHEVFIEQGRRGGPILALTRLLQAQAKCLRIILLVGEEAPERAYHFDLVGAHPVTEADDLPSFYEDMAVRVATAAGVKPVVEHEQVPPPVPRDVWQRLATPGQMCRASNELNAREFFTAMLRVADLVAVPALGDAVAEQYSEGCFATWDPALGALVATVTGSARPVNKGQLTPEEL